MTIARRELAGQKFREPSADPETRKVVISTLTQLSVDVGWISFRTRRVRRLTQGEPIILVQDGTPIVRNMRRERITLADIEEEARGSQIASVADLAWAILEDDGHISCIPRRS